MTKTIIVAGFGPGISNAVAKRFGREGYAVALVGRTADRVAAGAKELAGAGITAKPFVADLAAPGEVAAVVKKIQAEVGPVAALHWNAYAGGAGDLMASSADDIDAALRIAVASLVTAVQTAHADLRAHKGAVLVTNGGFGFNDPKVDQAGVQYNAMGLSIANAAKRKLVGLLSLKLAPDGIYVGEVIVTGTIKGSAYDRTNTGTIEPMTVADKFWGLAQARTETSVTV